MFLYFSGTGNSAWIAKKLGALIGEEAISINGYLKQKKFFADTECICGSHLCLADSPNCGTVDFALIF